MNKNLDNIEDLWNSFNKNLEELKELCKNNPSKIKKNKAANQSSVNIELKDENDKKTLCAIIDEVAEWMEWSIKVSEKTIELPAKFAEFIASVLGESIDYVLSLISQGIDNLIKWINNKLEEIVNNVQDKIENGDSKFAKKVRKIKRFIKKAIKKIKILILEVKKLILEAQLIVYKNTKTVIESLANGRAVAALDAVFAGALAALQSCAASISVGLQVVSAIIQSLLSAFMAIEGGTMAFFMTPKIILSGKLLQTMKPLELNNDIFSFGIMNIVNNVIDEYIKSINDINVATCTAYIVSMLAEFAVTGQITEGSVNIEKIDPEHIKKLVQDIIATLLANISEPMPKYEKISILNIRYLLWLTTVFQPSMKLSFGYPGMP